MHLPPRPLSALRDPVGRDKPVALKTGDELELGSTTLVVKLTAGVA